MKLHTFARKGLLLTGLALGAASSVASAQVSIDAATDAIAEGTTAATTIGTAGLGLMGVFLVFRLVRRAMNRAV